MGAMQAREMAELGSDNLGQTIEWHLRSNHFPPVPNSMVQPCIKAIEACNEEDYNRMIGLPEGVGYKGLTVAPAHAIVESHHLDAWID
jgi:hypothetical protein